MIIGNSCDGLLKGEPLFSYEMKGEGSIFPVVPLRLTQSIDC